MPPGKPPTNQSLDFQRRPGADPFGDAGWRGVNTEDDPGSLAPNELQLAENVRIRGKVITTRPGMEMLVDLGLLTPRGPSPVPWLSEAPGNSLHTRLWCSVQGCISPSDQGFQLYRIDPVEDPIFQRYINQLAATNRFSPIGRYGDRLILGDGPLIKEVQVISGPRGVNTSTIIGTSIPLIEIKKYDGYAARCIRDFNGALYIGLENLASAANSKVVRWDGSQWTDDITGIRPPLAMGYWRDKLVVGFDATAAHIRVRNPATTPVWTTVALAGFRCTSNQNSIEEYKGDTYIASGDDLIFRFDGTALTLVRTIPGCDTTGAGVTALSLHEGLLHYGWNAAATLNSRIGRLDTDSTATEYVDTYLDVTAQQVIFTHLSAMKSYRRQIYLGGQTALVLATAPNDVKGTLLVIQSDSVGAGVGCRQMVIFP